MKRKILSLSLALITVVAWAQPSEQVFYVSPSGDDAAEGSQTSPWRTPETAAVRVQAYMQAHSGQAVRLTFAEGSYRLHGPLVFEGLTSPLTLSGPATSEAILSGEDAVRGWTPVTDPDVLRRMPPSAAGRVLQADLRANGISEWGTATDRSNHVDLYCDGVRQTLARWPDTGFTKAGLAKGETDLPETWIHVHGTAEGRLEYLDPRMERWIQEQDPRMFGYWYWDWSDRYHGLAALDPVQKVMTLDEPWSHYGYRDSCRFYGLNLLCELDAPGEYYIDRGCGMIYWIAPEGQGTGAKTVLSGFAGEAMVVARNCKEFHIEDLAFEGARRAAVQIFDGEENVIRNCRFVRFGDTALHFKGGHGHRVEGCMLTELGCGGIDMTGGNRRTLESADFVVSNTIVERFSLFQRTYEPAVHFYGVGLLVSHNRFCHSSSSALRLEGNEITVEYNQCFNLVEESDDQGGFDTFMDYSYRGIVLRYNHWRDIKGGMFAGAAGIRFDDLISGQLVIGNVFERCGGSHFGGVQINGGRDNLIYNNVFYDCPWAVSGGVWSAEMWREVLTTGLSAQRLQEVDIFSPAYVAKYPLMQAHFNDPEGWNYVEQNLVINAKDLLFDGNRGFKTGGNAVLKSVQPLSYFLKPAVLRNHGVEPIPFDRIGVQENRWK